MLVPIKSTVLSYFNIPRAYDDNKIFVADQKGSKIDSLCEEHSTARERRAEQLLRGMRKWLYG